MMKKINAQLKIDRKEYDAIIPKPASAKELQQCQKELEVRGLPPIPQEYSDFLQYCCNGYDLGACFYGTKPMPIYNSDNFTDDLVTVNKKKKIAEYGLIEIGYGHHHNYFYNIENGLYETRWMTGNDLAREYKTFTEMFSYETAHFDYYG